MRLSSACQLDFCLGSCGEAIYAQVVLAQGVCVQVSHVMLNGQAILAQANRLVKRLSHFGLSHFGSSQPSGKAIKARDARVVNPFMLKAIRLKRFRLKTRVVNPFGLDLRRAWSWHLCSRV